MNRDPLTEAIFGEVEEKKESVFVREDEMDALTEAIFARLDSSAPAKPVPRLAKDELTRESILRQIEGLDDAEMAALEAQFISRPLLKRRAPQVVFAQEQVRPVPTLPRAEFLRAQDDWFQIRSRPLARPRFEIKKGKAWRTIIIIFIVGLLVLAGVAITTLRRSSGELPGASFVLLNAEQELVFPPLARLSAELASLSQDLLGQAKEEKGHKKELLAAAEEAEAIQEILGEFLESNQNFSWLNTFRSLSPSSPQSLDQLEEAINRAEALNSSSYELRHYLAWLRFWQRLLTQDGRYLVMEDNSSWAIWEVFGGRTSIHSTGRLGELNAALTTKLIPPPAVQIAKTNFDFYESGWFLDSRTQSEIIARLFSTTTKIKVDGVIMVSSEIIKEVSQGQGLANIISFLERTADWRGLERTLKNAFKTHNLALFFRDAELQSFVERKELAHALELGVAEDGLTVSIRSWEGEFSAQGGPQPKADEPRAQASGWEIEALEYSPEFFVDGSIISLVNVRVRNLSSSSDSAYLKLYLPLESVLLESGGFGLRRAAPAFNYESQEFKRLDELVLVENDAKKFAALDFFKEGDFLVVGGWVNAKPASASTVTLKYRLPFRLDWRGISDTYKLKVLKPGDIKELPFVFIAPINEEVSFELLVPSIVPGTLGEDLTLQAHINFDNL